MKQEEAIKEALASEYKSYALYEEASNRFSDVEIFKNINNAEARHIAALEKAAQKHGIELDESEPPKEGIKGGVTDYLEMMIVAERENIEMYDELIPQVEDENIKEIFFRLQAASYNNHLPALREHLRRAYGEKGGSERGFEEVTQVAQKFMKQLQGGKLEPEMLKKNIGTMVSKVSGDFVLGALGGAVLGAILGGIVSKKAKEE